MVTLPEDRIERGSIKLEPRAELVLGWRPAPGLIKAAAVEPSACLFFI
jgi:hypothetical protein